MKSRPIINPFNANLKPEDHNCFGCSPYNSDGLMLEFTDFGDYIESNWNPQKKFEGFKNILHGGIQSTLLDEVAAWVVFTKCATSGVTQKMQIRFHSPVHMNDMNIRLVGRLIEKEERLAYIKTELFNSENRLCAEADVEYYLFPEAVAKRKYAYPGLDAFYSQE